MAKKPTNHGKRWTDDQVKELKQLAKGNTPTRVMGIKLGRTEDATRSEATKENISLKPQINLSITEEAKRNDGINSL